MRAADYSKFWYIVTNVSEESAEDTGRWFFQNSGTLLQMFRRKLLKIQAGDSFKILVHCYKRFKRKCWRCRQEILPKVLVHSYQNFKEKFWIWREQILPKFWYIATTVSNESAKVAGRRFFQNSGILLQMFQRKMLKIQAGDFSKILVHSYQFFKEKFWIWREQILTKFWYFATKVSKESAEVAGRRFFQNSGTHVMHCVTSFP